MTRKELQNYNNETANAQLQNALNMLANHGACKVERLRTCSATVYETFGYYILKSYNTYIACIDKYDRICYDCLRTVYGYTSTSAQHVYKFHKDYGATQRITTR